MDHLASANRDANPELMRLALKLATGAGKTTVMAMLIAWQTITRKDMPEKGRGQSEDLDPLKLPTRLQTALQAHYGHYEKTFKLWDERGIKVPPCFIIAFLCSRRA